MHTEREFGVSPRWLVYYYLFQIACQLTLLSNFFASGRAFFRTASFSISLLALMLTAGMRSRVSHPVRPIAIVAMVILVAESFHPETAGPLSALATIAIYAAILGPLIWVPKFRLDLEGFRTLVLVIWSFQTISALVGVLQVYFPDVFQPAISTVLSDDYVSTLKITLANGREILRPSGLTDTPGGAGAAGAYAVLLSIGLLSTKPRMLLRLVLAVSITAGMFVIYLCQIRSLLLMVGISTSATILMHTIQGRFKSSVAIGAVVAALAAVGLLAALSSGGDSVANRLSTLTTSSPTEVYYTNRGFFLERTITDLLPEYPLGAGLGRWGMFSRYFETSSAPIYVEIQWTGWLLDGGILLIIVYLFMLLRTGKLTWDIGRHGSGDLAAWAAVLVGYDVGAVALTFNYPVFVSSLGLDFWLLNAALFSVAANERSRTHRPLDSRGAVTKLKESRLASAE